ncbi:MAG: DUF2335 domain-containing protein [Pseudomonadota bacterium]|nr:DUF2335 domain-containing protein [Pseudomonadota bacterium]
MAKPPESGGGADAPETPAQEIVNKLTPILRPEQRREAERVIGMVLQKTHSGPLPAPEDLAHYDAICPGAANRIITMAESNMGHRQAMERTLVRTEYGLRTRGQWLALIALFAMLAVIAFTFWIGQPIAGAVLGSATLIAVTGMFLGRDSQASELEPEPARPQAKTGKSRGKRK